MANELLASSPLALALLDRDLRFVAVNEAAAEINGIPAAEHAGRLWSELLPGLAARYGPAVRRAIEEDRPILGDEVSGETPRLPGVQRWWRVHWLPVREQTEVIGVAALFHEITIEKELRDAHETLLAQQLQIAHVLQQRLLPQRLPPVPGCEVATRYRAAGSGIEVGGDFYDLVLLRDGAWLAVIGDIAGKGPTAAALTAVVRQTIRAIAKREEHPTPCLLAANDALLSEESLQLCSVVAARVQPEGAAVRLIVVTAGHPPALVLRSDGGIEPVSAPGTILGLSESPRLRPYETRLHAGDSLVLYTDGITDVPAPGGTLGEEPLHGLLAGLAGAPADEIARRIERATREWQPGDPRDDLAVLVLRASGATGGVPS